eukprot:1156924-Pelagomonas_calceolata.AAC.3
MTQHHTCPICRVLLEPEDAVQPAPQEQQHPGGDTPEHWQGQGAHGGQAPANHAGGGAAMAGREGRLWTAAAATAGPSAPGQVALQMPAEAAGVCATLKWGAEMRLGCGAVCACTRTRVCVCECVCARALACACRNCFLLSTKSFVQS